MTAALFSRVVVRGFWPHASCLAPGAPVAALIATARELWEYLAGTAAGFAPAISVAVAPRSSLCPPGWAGVVVIGDAALATAPDHGTALLVGQALSGLPAASLTGADVLRRRLRMAEIRGPAALAYLDPADFRPQRGAGITGPLDLDHPGLQRFLMAAGADDVGESGIQQITSPGLSPPASTARSLPPPATGTGPAARRISACLPLPQRGAAAWPAPLRQRPSPMRSGREGCRNGGHGLRHPGALPAPWDSANSAPR